ncbi:MAG: class IV adenylate cyclase [Candidatus Pacebacteria bacterium]|nr:class IV adenylate cyclase [Candidatus Paceibacterota bacterium]
MAENNREIEVKFKVESRQQMQEKINGLGTVYEGQAFERTVLFDTPEDALREQGRFLRVRSGFKNVITLKTKIANPDFKEREEIELEISDLPKMEIILRALGFSKARIMEKRRKKWSLGEAEITLDELPFGDYLEIEAAEARIREIAAKLGLDFNDKITHSYWGLWREITNPQNPTQGDIVF